MIRTISIENFKSIYKLEFELGRFNVLIGANGAGKSNVLEGIVFGSAALSKKLDHEFFGFQRANLIINPQNKNEGSKYVKISKDFLKQKNIRKHVVSNPSFKLFLDQLEDEFKLLGTNE